MKVFIAILVSIFGSLGATIIAAIVVAHYKGKKARCEREREKKITKRTKELNDGFEHRKTEQEKLKRPPFAHSRHVDYNRSGIKRGDRSEFKKRRELE